MARNRVPAKPSPVRTPSPKHWTSPQTHCSPSVREQTRMLFILGRSLFAKTIAANMYPSWRGEERKRQMEHARPMAAPFLQTYLCMTRSRT